MRADTTRDYPKHADHGPSRSRLAKAYGPWAVVTGASSGIGRAIAVELARNGVGVALVARRREPLDRFAAEIAERFGVATRVVIADFADPLSPQAVAAATADLDVGLLVAAAGFGTTGALVDLPVEQELEMIDVNCRALVALCAIYGRRLASRGGGGIVLLSSLLAFQGAARAATYAATKAFVQTFAEGLRGELAPAGVAVLASAPGPVRTGFGERADMRMSFADDPAVVARHTLKALGRRATVRPGVFGKSLAASLAFVPRWGRTIIMGQVVAGMTKHQAEATSPRVAMTA